MEKHIFLNPIPAIEVVQGEDNFFIFKILAKTLLSIAYTSERTKSNQTGIQRGLRRDRLISIGKYLQGKSSGNPILPNTIIVSLSRDSYYEEGFLNVASKPFGEAFIIDGQHRLWSFQEEFSGDFDMEIVVSAFIELPDQKKALVFKTINGEQRKINPSLVYDLIPMLQNNDWVVFEDLRSKDIVSFLSSDLESPWYNRISMVGEPGMIISQSSFMTAIKKLLKKDHLFSTQRKDFTEVVVQENLLKIYFNSIAEQYSVEWDNKDFLLCKYIGVSALLGLLELIVHDLTKDGKSIVNDKGLVVNEINFHPYILKLRAYSFSAKDAKLDGKSYVGEGGVNELLKRITSIVFK